MKFTNESPSSKVVEGRGGPGLNNEIPLSKNILGAWTILLDFLVNCSTYAQTFAKSQSVPAPARAAVLDTLYQTGYT